MREFLIILTIVIVLLALTAVKYRKQIAGLIGVARMLKEAKKAVRQSSIRGGEPPGVQLVNCAKCGVWVPQDKAIRVGGSFVCSEHRAETRA